MFSDRFPEFFFKMRYGEFLLLRYEIQSTGKMTEGTVPVPPAAPALSDDNVLPFQGLSQWGEPQRRG
jgi:hypothetical protein